MIEIKLREKYRGGVVKKQKSKVQNSGKSQGSDKRVRTYTYDPAQHVLIIGANGKRRWVHSQ